MEVVLEREAAKYLAKTNEPLKSRLGAALKALGDDPPKGDIKPLTGYDNHYRVRVGDYRIAYSISAQKVVVHDIAPRGQVYKGGRKR